MMALVRDHLSSIAADYVEGLQKLLSVKQPEAESAASSRFRKAQEEFNMGLFNELGVGVSRDSDQVRNA